MSLRNHGLLAAGAVLVLALAAACGSDASPATTPAAGASAGQPALVVQDPWVKTAKSGMSAAYGTVVNPTGKDVVVVSAASAVSPKIELHETTTVDGKMAMRPKQGGFVVPANGSHEFKPGGDHFMLMDVTTEVKAGDQVTFTLTLQDGGTVRFTALGKDFAGGNESYLPGTPSPMTMG
ncbi:copper chaperone PCu(A)C [Dactylosporangium sp. NPDC049525]|uniref:copper chaperone PCu(A)C n=1 Tax=Dactylosporangium sp. NPDC049525 TaxID=3154730 RepID=UPI00341519E0